MIQLPLDFELKVDATFSNFMAGENSLLVEALKNINRAECQFIYFYGELGTGKTHLLQAVAHETANLPDCHLAYLPLKSELLAPELLSNFENFDCVCLDDIESILHQENSVKWQEAIFNLYNQLKDQNKSLIITASEPPAGLDLPLKDLKSRLSAMLIHEIKPLSDNDKQLYIQEKAGEKGISLNEDLALFLLSRGRRDLASINQNIEQLDAASMQAKRKITKPFIKEILGF